MVPRRRRLGGVSELVDEHDLGSCAAMRKGSSPFFPTSEMLDYASSVFFVSGAESRREVSALGLNQVPPSTTFLPHA